MSNLGASSGEPLSPAAIPLPLSPRTPRAMTPPRAFKFRPTLERTPTSEILDQLGKGYSGNLDSIKSPRFKTHKLKTRPLSLGSNAYQSIDDSDLAGDLVDETTSAGKENQLPDEIDTAEKSEVDIPNYSGVRIKVHSPEKELGSIQGEGKGSSVQDIGNHCVEGRLKDKK